MKLQTLTDWIKGERPWCPFFRRTAELMSAGRADGGAARGGATARTKCGRPPIGARVAAFDGRGGRRALLCALTILLAACGPEDPADRDRGADADGMRPGMMMRMMENMPQGIPASALPDPDSHGARLVARYCSQCHGIPTPKRLSAAEWPATLERMFARMEQMEGMGGMMDVEVPAAEEREQLLAYLQAHALRTVSEAELLGGGPDAALFARTCSRCHALPDPTQHTPEEWPSVVARMRENMQRMDVEGIMDEEARRIIRYLQRAAMTENGSSRPDS